MKVIIPKKKDEVTIGGRYTFPASTSLIQKANGGYYLNLDFDDTNKEALENLAHISAINQPIRFRSKLVNDVIELNRFIILSQKNRTGKVSWHCHSFCALPIQECAT